MSQKLRTACLLLAMLLVFAPARADDPTPAVPTIKMLPAKLELAVGRLGEIVLDSEGDETKYLIVPKDAAALFREYDPSTKRIRLRLIGYSIGQADLVAFTATAAALSEPYVCHITFGTPAPLPPGPGPAPDPAPPNPIPPDDDQPAGLRVLFLYESKDLMTRDQHNAFYSNAVEEYMNSHCVKGAGGRPEWRRWDQHIPPANEAKHWTSGVNKLRGLLTKDQKKLPVVYASNPGKGGDYATIENEAQLLDFLKKYGGP